MEAFQNSKDRPYIPRRFAQYFDLVDGAVADNIGVRGVRETLEELRIGAVCIRAGGRLHDTGNPGRAIEVLQVARKRHPTNAEVGSALANYRAELARNRKS